MTHFFGIEALKERTLTADVAAAPRGVNAESLLAQSSWGTVDVLDRIADEWRELCQEGPCDQPFFRPEWIASSARAFGHDRRLLLITVREGERLRGVLPLWEQKTRVLGVPVVKLSSAGSPDHSPRFDFIHGRGSGLEEVVHAVWNHLRSMPEWDVIECRNIPEGGAVELLLRIARKDEFLAYKYLWADSPYIALDSHGPRADSYSFIRSRRFRHRVRLSRRRLQEKGEICLRRVETADPETIQQFYCLEKSGWKGRKGTAIDCQPETRRFYDSVAKHAARFGYLSLYFLEQNGRPLAAHFALTYAGRYYPLKVAYDESYGQYGPGHLIIAAVIEDCVARGLVEFDCLGHQTEAKSRWTTQVRPHNFCYIFRNGMAGRMLFAERFVSRKLQSGLRQLLATVRRPRARNAIYAAGWATASD
jgi:CelD/BcsL family acetyltransferase involved in cellulose biosynthesis